MNFAFATRHRHLALAALALGLLVAGTWLAVQGGWWPAAPPDVPTGRALELVTGKVVGTVALVAEALPVLGMMWLGAAGLGALLRRGLVREARYRAVVQLGLGLAALLLCDWILGWAGALGPYTAWLLGGAGGALIAWQAADLHRTGRLHPDLWPAPPWTLLLGLPVGGLLLVACACPPGTLWAVEAFGYDVLSYHLQLPREWLALGQIRGLHHNVYSYLPNLVEAGYLQIAAMQRSMSAALYTCQLFHASTALFTLAVLACTVSRFVGRAAGVLAAMVLLATPWTLITASLAYDEWAALGLVATAVLLLLDPVSAKARGAAAIGFLLGAAALAKLTIGAMLIPPVLLVMALRLHHGRPWSLPVSWRRGLGTAAVALLVCAVTIAPYLVRNWKWTGNPIFPFATGVLGRGHWSPELAQRWDAAHHPQATVTQRLALLSERWLLSPGFGAVGGWPAADDPAAPATRDVTRFAAPNGWPALLLAAAGGAALLLAWSAGRRLVLLLLILLIWPIAFWLSATHLQGRFLLPTLLPLGLFVGLGAGRLEQLTRQRSRYLFPALALALVAALTVSSFGIFYEQTFGTRIEGRFVHVPPWEIVDSLASPADLAAAPLAATPIGDHPLNHLPPASRPCLIADAAVLYVRLPAGFAYHSAFDAEPLGDLLRRSADDPRAITRALRLAGCTHIWINWSELDRLHATYGYDPAVTADRLRDLAQQARWQTVHDFGPATLYALP